MGNDEGDYEQCEEHDDLDNLYRSDAGHPDAVGVGALDYDERVRQAAAPLGGPQIKIDAFPGATDCVSAARKAAQAAAAAATEHNQNNMARAKLSVPSFPKSGEMTNWVYSLGTATVVSGCYGDALQVKLLRECWSKALDELECSDMDNTPD